MSTPTDTTDFRNAMARFASGVTVVTTRDEDGDFVGFTASAFSSLSLEPPLLLVCLQNDADCYDAFMQEPPHFGVSILARGQAEIALRFATKGIDKVAGTPVIRGPITGLPLIEGATAHAECHIGDRILEGDHTILIGEVLQADSNEREPLLHFNRQFGRFQPDEA